MTAASGAAVWRQRSHGLAATSTGCSRRRAAASRSACLRPLSIRGRSRSPPVHSNRSAVRDHPGQAVVAVGHGDLIPMYLFQTGLVDGFPAFRTGSLFRLEAGRSRAGKVELVDRKELKRQLEDSS